MRKSNIKHFIIVFLLACLTSSSTFASSISSSNINTLMSSSLDSLSNIQKQLETISRNLYANASANANENSLNQLAIYSNQLNNIKNELESISETDLNQYQIDAHRGVLSVERFLDYIALKLSIFEQTNDQFEKYNILNTIIVTNTLVDIMLANITVPQS